MKIVIVNSFYDPNMVGGTEHSVKLLAEGLSKNNGVSVFTIDNLKNKGIEKSKINNVNVYRCSGGFFSTKVRLNKKGSVLRKITNKILEFHNPYISKVFKKFIMEVNPDVIHTNNLYGLSPVIWKVAKKQNIKIIHTLRDYWMLDPSVENKNRKNVFIKMYQSFFRKQSRYVNFVTAPSACTLDTFLKNRYFLNALFSVVPNCISIDFSYLQAIIRKREKENKKEIHFIYVGMLDEKKGILNLLNVFTNIKMEELKLNICGKGVLENVINDFCQKDSRIKYLGQLSKEKLENVWLQNDVCIVPSIWDEPFGRVVIEANLFGLPVIGSNRGGIFEILSNIQTGELFEFDNLEDLKEKILYFSDRQNIKKYYNNILKNLQMYSLENQIDNFYKIYSHLKNSKN